MVNATRAAIAATPSSQKTAIPAHIMPPPLPIIPEQPSHIPLGWARAAVGKAMIASDTHSAVQAAR